MLIKHLRKAVHTSADFVYLLNGVYRALCVKPVYAALEYSVNLAHLIRYLLASLENIDYLHLKGFLNIRKLIFANYFLNKQQPITKRFRRLRRICLSSLISQRFRGYCCESDILLYKWKFTKNYTYSLFTLLTLKYNQTNV